MGIAKDKDRTALDRTVNLKPVYWPRKWRRKGCDSLADIARHMYSAQVAKAFRVMHYEAVRS